MIQKKTAAVYYRVSTTQQADANGIDSQRFVVEQWLSAYGHKDTKVYTDLAKSGANTNRPAFKMMMLAIRRGEHDLIVTHDLSRIGRSLLDLLEFVREIKKLGVRMVFVKEGISADDASGNFFLNMLGAAAQYEREKLSERTKAGIAAARQKDESWGMGRRPKHLRPEPKNKIATDAAIAKLMAELDEMDASERGEYIRDKADEWGMTESGLRSRVQRARG